MSTLLVLPWYTIVNSGKFVRRCRVVSPTLFGRAAAMTSLYLPFSHSLAILLSSLYYYSTFVLLKWSIA